MPFNGSGTFTRSHDWTDDAANGIDITASRFDTEHDGFATGLSNAICRDGQSTISASIPFNNQKITGLGDATAAGDALDRRTGDARYPVMDTAVSIASAATTDIGAAASSHVLITGTTTITSLGTVAAGTVRFVRFAAALTLTYNATSLILPGSANITTAADDTAIFVSQGSGNWRCIEYTRRAAAPFNGASASALTTSAKTASYTLATSDIGTVIQFASLASNVALTVGAATGFTGGFWCYVRNADDNNFVTLSITGGASTDLSSGTVVLPPNSTVLLRSDASNWFISGDVRRKVKLASSTASGTSVAFTAIAQFYKDLMLTFEGVSHSDGVSQQMVIQAGPGLYSEIARIGGTVTSTATLSGAALIPDYRYHDGSSAGDAFCTGGVRDTQGTGASYVIGGVDATFSSATSAITQVRVEWGGGASFDAGTITLYGLL